MGLDHAEYTILVVRMKIAAATVIMVFVLHKLVVLYACDDEILRSMLVSDTH